MSDDLIRYDVLATEALRGVVRKVLTEVSKTGLPGEHHFFISFDTRHPGVRISTALRERYPQEMTIVLQHQFWDLEVHEHAFEVGLSFSGAPENLLVPFAAVTGFADPSVEFSLRFETVEVPMEELEGAEDIAASQEEAKEEKNGKNGEAVEKLGKKQQTKKEKDDSETEKGEKADNSDDDKAGAEVVSLDSFRKKT